jgi:hypothetical protein
VAVKSNRGRRSRLAGEHKFRRVWLHNFDGYAEIVEAFQKMAAGDITIAMQAFANAMT